MEYASLLGRHGIVGQLLLGGVDPTVGGYVAVEDEAETTERRWTASRQVLGLLHSLNHHEDNSQSKEKPPVVPLSMWSYIIRSVVEMRINGGLVLLLDDSAKDGNATCQMCQNQAFVLIFGPPCHHGFCETCLWNHLVQHVPNCICLTRKVVTCPICHEEFQEFQCCPSINNLVTGANSIHHDNNAIQSELFEMDHESKSDTVSLPQIYEQRRLDSFAKFMQLPSTSAELKLLTKKDHSQFALRRKKMRDPISSTWHQALFPVISNHLSRDVRTDRFFKAVISSPQVVMCYLQMGMDVNLQNKYGQTPLYVACWRGSVVIVQCLLEFGANPWVVANGGGTCQSVARRFGRMDVLRTLERYCFNDEPRFGLRCSGNDWMKCQQTGSCPCRG
jgi:hypothetical protein